MKHGLQVFEDVRPSLLSLAYRMLGDVQRVEDIVQDAWLRWERRDADVQTPKAYLIKVVTRLCLNELDSARARKEEARGDRLPEPLDLAQHALGRVEALDQISMAFLVVLQRLTPAERAVFLLHEIFDFEHGQIARMVEKSESACRQLLKRARDHVATERRSLTVSSEVHRRLLRAFLEAASTGDTGEVAKLLTDDVVLIADAGRSGGTYGGVRNVPRPIVGPAKVAAVAPRGAVGLTTRECDLNGQPAILVLRDGRPYAAILLSVMGEKLLGIFMQADPLRLRHIGH